MSPRAILSHLSSAKAAGPFTTMLFEGRGKKHENLSDASHLLLSPLHLSTNLGRKRAMGMGVDSRSFKSSREVWLASKKGNPSAKAVKSEKKEHFDREM
jgi:hypothetical protein